MSPLQLGLFRGIGYSVWFSNFSENNAVMPITWDNLHNGIKIIKAINTTTHSR